MPTLDRHVAHRLGEAVSVARRETLQSLGLAKRVLIPVNKTSPPELVAASHQDPWKDSGKYALGWVYFCIILLLLTLAMRLFHLWSDKIRTALYKEELSTSMSSSPSSDYEMRGLGTGSTETKLFPRPMETAVPPKSESTLSSMRPLNKAIAVCRLLLYRPIPSLRWRKRTITFRSIGALTVCSCAFAFVTLYCFVPQPLYYESIRFGSPPVAIRAGMIAVAMMPWIIAMSMKANIVSMITGIGHERLNVYHRWGGYICLFLSLVHTIPFYLQPAREPGSLEVFRSYFKGHGAIYGTGAFIWELSVFVLNFVGIACLVPLIWLCVASLPVFRSWMYELFVALHVPVSILYVAMLFWHCRNFLTSWNYLWATVAIWISSYVIRLFKLNWTNPWRLSWLIGDEAVITVLPENAIRLTIPTQVRWKPGQFVYLRIPGISVFENHPFTIASLCSDDFPSEYGDRYRDMALVFKPFSGFTGKVLNMALRKDPSHTYRVYLDGPYGGMQRCLESFDNVVLIAGGSGITAIMSHILDLVKKMRDGKAITKKVQVVWAVKRLETLDWFREELRICREYAPPDSVECNFFITASKRQAAEAAPKGHRPISGIFGSDKINDLAQGIASKRSSALIREDAAGDVEKERELRREREDGISALPGPPNQVQPPKRAHTRQKPSLDLRLSQAPQANFDFGFPSTPTMFQKNIMRFAFGVSGVKQRDGWAIEYGRPDIPYMLKDYASTFGKRSCVFVCGPPGMRMDVSSTVARLQHQVLRNPLQDEIYLHYEDFAY